MKRLILACLGVLLTATVAYADQPSISRESNTFDLALVSCNGFDLNFHFINEFQFKFFVDKEGVLRTLHQFGRADIEISREGFPEKTLYGRRADNQIIDFPDGNVNGFVVNGVLLKVVLPGYGPLFFETGRTVFDSNFNYTVVNGIHDYFLQHTDAICAYFN